ncbi:LytR/AlgR family response regulator transcription factor [Pseudohalioglobus lutimaris]|uniref:DNA-binding response regulator n=1 Tax=Pseudohalioglobus lutimaris TaxID=1737061 RepID=A0A2N5X1Z2_9GAMM|nr:LytTR family DNA-binding domain-containing protein [Pseudohalioglobus lutimaris]PLW68498.1 DNA-binding response regulator [Pseudohalioglobus lutimaris]
MKVLVVDDEQLARERLLRLLGSIRPGAECLQAAGGAEAMQIVAAREPDVVLLDIRMPGMDGIEVAAELDKLQSPPAVIFCTAYDEYALQALQHQAMAYLLKPVREAELDRALEGAGRVNRVQLASLQQGEGAAAARSTISSQTHRGFESMPVTEVRCFIAGQKYVTAVAPEMELLIPDTLKDLEQEFGGRFLRVHRNALVALDHVERLEKIEDGSWRVILHDLEQAPAISRRHLSEVKQRLSQR